MTKQRTLGGAMGGLLLLSGCAVTSEAPIEYFLLNSTSSADEAVLLEPFRVGVGPVELAPYLDQDGIANHLDSNQIEYAIDRLWAEPLGSNVSRVLLSNLTTLLPNQTVYSFPWRVSQTPDFQLRININRFGWFGGNEVKIEARVRLENKDGDIVFSNEENMGLRAGGTDYQSNVAAQNTLLDRFSRRLAEILARHAGS